MERIKWKGTGDFVLKLYLHSLWHRIIEQMNVGICVIAPIDPTKVGNNVTNERICVCIDPTKVL
jgi:hypothetical protein